ncbi:MAG: aldo/keto reductase [Rhodospirillaceae bacterium]|nr:aldo/keto reductase [Rhodospirillaceae bacterium]
MLNRRDILAASAAATVLAAASALAQSAPSGGAKGSMRYRTLGNSDLKVSVLGLGCNSYGAAPGQTGGRFLDLEATRAVVNAAFDSGVTFFDTADIYGADGGSEKFIGEILKDRRKQVVIATKWGYANSQAGKIAGDRAHIRQSVEASLRRLQTDYIDLYQYHFPDNKTPIGETLQVLEDLKREGKVRYIGASNFSAAQLEEADKTARNKKLARFISLQNQYSLLETDAEKDVLPACEKLKIGFLPYFPLASGLLTGKYRRNNPAPEGARLANRPIDDATYTKIEKLEAFAKQRGHTLLDLAFAGLIAHPQMGSVIAGATKPNQIRENAASIGWELTAGDVAELRKLTASI